ncbi:hypothetical protein BC829DRAFT_494276 [Chytridium lagenaria]|nr:hypothetical protein BC829DRAFT_494276 [Chytridium lagenaria]
MNFNSFTFLLALGLAAMAVADPGLASGPKLPGINISITGPSPSPVPRLRREVPPKPATSHSSQD